MVAATSLWLRLTPWNQVISGDSGYFCAGVSSWPSRQATPDNGAFCLAGYFRIVAGKVESPAFLALHGTTNDEVGCEDKVAQLNQVMTDPEIGIELVDLAHQ